MKHLEEAKRCTERAICVAGAYRAQVSAQLAIAHALIAIAERLPPPAETWSARSKRLKEEEQDGV